MTADDLDTIVRLTKDIDNLVRNVKAMASGLDAVDRDRLSRVCQHADSIRLLATKERFDSLDTAHRRTLAAR